MTDTPTSATGEVIVPVVPTLVTDAEPVTDTWTVRMVVIFLAVLGIVSLIAGGVLAGLVITRAYDAAGDGEAIQIDATVALLLGGFMSVTTGCMASLGTILASTRGAFTKNR